MSDKKGLKQSRLPFQILTSTSPKIVDSKTISAPEKSPKTPSTSVSRKRKQSSEGENVRSSKIGRTNSKENIIAEQDKVVVVAAIEIVDSGDDNDGPAEESVKNDSIIETNKLETTPTANSSGTRKIKIGSCSKRKQVIKPLPNVDADDSIVYLDDEEIQSIANNKKSKKSTKKSEKKKSAGNKNHSTRSKAKNSLDLNEQGTTEEPMDVDVIVLENDNKEQQVESTSKNDDDQDVQITKKVKIILNKVNVSEESTSVSSAEKEVDSKPNAEESLKVSDSPTLEEIKPISDEISKLVDKSTDDSTNKELHDDIVEVLTDDENNSPTNTSVLKTTPKLTPKAIARRKELEVKRVEKEQQRQKERDEREKLRLKEKAAREEAKKKEREEKEEQRKREKDEREKKRLAEIEKKEEERRQKEEEKRQKDEEKRLKEEERKRLLEQKEEEKRAKEEERRQKEEERKRQNEAREEEKKKKEIEKIKEEERKKKAAQVFSKFFVPTKKKSEQQVVDDEASKESAESSDTARGNFMPFQIHGKMRLAPRVRCEITKEQKESLDEILKSEKIETDTNKLYVKQIKNPEYVRKFSTKTWPDTEDEKYDDDIVVVDELEGVGEDIKEDDAHLKMKHRTKLLLFVENRRPAYYGTWRKTSNTISARRPFAHDPKFFDYEVDSDEEWEEEEPGESLHGSDSEKEKVEEDDYEVDDDFFVPHGHLSEDEMQHDGEIMEDNSPETQKAKLKVLQQEFAAEMKKKTEKIKPRLIGCIWMNGDEDENGGSKSGNLEKKYHCSDIIWRILKAREMMSNGDEIKMEDFEPEIIESEEDNNNTDEKTTTKQQKTPASIKVRPKIEGESVKELIRLLHGNINSKKFLIKEYQAYRLKTYYKLADFQEFLTKNVEEKMNEISLYKTCPDEGEMFGKKCWYVKEDVVKEYFGDEKLPLPNQWTYILEKEKKVKPVANIGTDSKKGSREVTPTDEKDDVQIVEPIVQESPKPSSALKHTNLAKNSPKTPTIRKGNQSQKPTTPIQTVSSAKKKPKTPVQVKPATPTQNNPSMPVQNKTTVNGSTANSGKKRVSLLMSVKPGQSIDMDKKNDLINQFLKTNQSNRDAAGPSKDNEVIEIID